MRDTVKTGYVFLIVYLLLSSVYTAVSMDIHDSGYTSDVVVAYDIDGDGVNELVMSSIYLDDDYIFKPSPVDIRNGYVALVDIYGDSSPELLVYNATHGAIHRKDSVVYIDTVLKYGKFYVVSGDDVIHRGGVYRYMGGLVYADESTVVQYSNGSIYVNESSYSAKLPFFSKPELIYTDGEDVYIVGRQQTGELFTYIHSIDSNQSTYYTLPISIDISIWWGIDSDVFLLTDYGVYRLSGNYIELIFYNREPVYVDLFSMKMYISSYGTTSVYSLYGLEKLYELPVYIDSDVFVVAEGFTVGYTEDGVFKYIDWIGVPSGNIYMDNRKLYIGDSISIYTSWSGGTAYLYVDGVLVGTNISIYNFTASESGNIEVTLVVENPLHRYVVSEYIQVMKIPAEPYIQVIYGYFDKPVEITVIDSIDVIYTVEFENRTYRILSNSTITLMNRDESMEDTILVYLEHDIYEYSEVIHITYNLYNTRLDYEVRNDELRLRVYAEDGRPVESIYEIYLDEAEYTTISGYRATINLRDIYGEASTIKVIYTPLEKGYLGGTTYIQLEEVENINESVDEDKLYIHREVVVEEKPVIQEKVIVDYTPLYIAVAIVVVVAGYEVALYIRRKIGGEAYEEV